MIFINNRVSTKEMYLRLLGKVRTKMSAKILKWLDTNLKNLNDLKFIDGTNNLLLDMTEKKNLSILKKRYTR